MCVYTYKSNHHLQCKGIQFLFVNYISIKVEEKSAKKNLNSGSCFFYATKVSKIKLNSETSEDNHKLII